MKRTTLAAALALAVLACGGDPAPVPVPADTCAPTQTTTETAETPVAIVEPDYCLDSVIVAHEVSDGVLTLIHEVEALRDDANADAINALLELLEAYDGPYDELLLEIGCDPSAW